MKHIYRYIEKDALIIIGCFLLLGLSESLVDVLYNFFH